MPMKPFERVSTPQVKASPFLEKVESKGYEVIYMVSVLDEYLIQTVHEFEGIELQSVTKVLVMH